MKPKQSGSTQSGNRVMQQSRGPHESRLISYGLAAGALLAGGAAAQADIVFWDLSSSPQTTAVNGSLYFNFKTGDVGPSPPATPGSGTFHLQQQSSGPPSSARRVAEGVGVLSSLGTAKVAVVLPAASSALELQPQDVIDSNRAFQVHGLMYASISSLVNGLWSLGDTAFLGIEFADTDGLHYGWAEVTLNNDFTTTLRGFAYETDPDTAIEAGQIPLQLTKAVSRITHGAAGAFDINLPLITPPLAGPPGVECRSGGAGGNYLLIFTFTTEVIAGSASLNPGAVGSVGTTSFAANEMTVHLNGIGQDQEVTVTLNNVKDDFDQVLPATSVKIDFVLGDTNGTALVGASDVSQTKSESGHSLGEANFREDVTVNGAINSSDIALVKSRSGHGIPPPIKPGLKPSRR